MKNGIYKTIKSYNGLSTLKDAPEFPYAIISSKCDEGSDTCAIITDTNPKSNPTCPSFMGGVNYKAQNYWKTKDDGTNKITCIPGTPDKHIPAIINCTDINKNPISCCENVGTTDIGIIVPKEVSWNGVKSDTQISQAQCAKMPLPPPPSYYCDESTRTCTTSKTSYGPYSKETCESKCKSPNFGACTQADCPNSDGVVTGQRPDCSCDCRQNSGPPPQQHWQDTDPKKFLYGTCPGGGDCADVRTIPTTTYHAIDPLTGDNVSQVVDKKCTFYNDCWPYGTTTPPFGLNSYCCMKDAPYNMAAGHETGYDCSVAGGAFGCWCNGV